MKWPLQALTENESLGLDWTKEERDIEGSAARSLVRGLWVGGIYCMSYKSAVRMKERRDVPANDQKSLGGCGFRTCLSPRASFPVALNQSYTNGRTLRFFFSPHHSEYRNLKGGDDDKNRKKDIHHTHNNTS